MATLDGLLLQHAGIRLATADCADNNATDSASASKVFNSGTFGRTPSAFCPAGSLQYTGYLEWTIAGTYTASGAGTLQMQLMVDNTAAGTTMVWTTATVDAAHFLLVVRMAISGDTTTATDFQVMEARLTVIRDSDNTSIIDSVARHAIHSVDSKLDHDLGLIFVQATGTGSGVITGTTCIHVGQKSGT